MNVEQSDLPLQIPFPGHRLQSEPVEALLPRRIVTPASRDNKMKLTAFLVNSVLFIF